MGAITKATLACWRRTKTFWIISMWASSSFAAIRPSFVQSKKTTTPALAAIASSMNWPWLELLPFQTDSKAECDTFQHQQPSLVQRRYRGRVLGQVKAATLVHEVLDDGSPDGVLILQVTYLRLALASPQRE